MEHTKHIFLSVTQRVFSNWTALKLAVEHDMGSVEDARCFCNAVTEMIYSSKSCNMSSTLDAYLDDYMYDKFSTELEDDSQYEVADELEKFVRYFKDGEMIKAEQDFDKLPPLQSWINTDRHTNVPCESVPAENNISNTMEEQNTSEDEDEEDKEDEESMDIEDDTVDKNKDTDGWTLVTNKRNK